MIKAEVIVDNTAWKKKIRNTTLIFNRILNNLPKKYIIKNQKTLIEYKETFIIYVQMILTYFNIIITILLIMIQVIMYNK